MSKVLWQSWLVSPAILGVLLLASLDALALDGRNTLAFQEEVKQEAIAKRVKSHFGSDSKESALIATETPLAAVTTEPQSVDTNNISPTAEIKLENAKVFETEKTTPVAQVPADSSNSNVVEPINVDSNENATDSLEQITNVSQLRDVSPRDWAYEALRSLVERYGCIAGYPNRTFRGNKSLSRYEFAAGLNACLQQIERLAKSIPTDLPTKETLVTIERLIESFGPELAIVRARVDALEARTGELELTQFSTTTKLNGEVIFGFTGTFSGEGAFGERVDDIRIFGSRTRLNLETSFTGKDLLRTRLQAQGLNTFTSRTQTYEGNMAFAAEDAKNSVEIDALLYKFPIGKKTELVIAANGGAADDFASTINFLDGDGATGALTRFGTRNPIYYLVEGAGIGLRHQFSNSLELSLGYLADDASNPGNSGGLFKGAYGALAQLVYKPSSKFQVGLTYINSYNREMLTGSRLANPQTYLRNLADQKVNVNFQPPGLPTTPQLFPAGTTIPAGQFLPTGTQLPVGTTLLASTTLPFPITVAAPPPLGTITIPAGRNIPAGTTLPAPITLPIDLPLPAPISLPIDLTIPAGTTPPPPPVAFNGTLGDLLSQPQFAGFPLGFDLNIPIKSNSVGVELSWQVSEGFVVGGWFGYTKTQTLSTGNGLFSGSDIDILNGALTLAFPNLGRKGNLGGLIVGVEPFVVGTNIKGNPSLLNPTSVNPALVPAALALVNSTPIGQLIKNFNDPDPNVSLHIEGFYQMRLTENISVTPGVIVITSPGFDARNSSIVIGTIRTTFSF